MFKMNNLFKTIAAVIILSGLTGADVSFGGTSLIIIVGVIIETIRQIDSQAEERHLTGILSRKD